MITIILSGEHASSLARTVQTHQVPIDASQLRQAGRAVCREETRTVGAHSRLLLQGQVAKVLEGSCLIFSLENVVFLELFFCY